MKQVTRPIWTALSIVGLLAGMSISASAQSGSRNAPPSGSGAREQPSPGSGSRTTKPALGLEGYCPVSIVAMRKWVKGDPAQAVVYDGRSYRFADEKGKKMFQDDPAKYVPALGGDCVVALVKMGKRVPGNIRHAAFHDSRLFLFSNEQAQQMFLADASAYAHADLALDGKCPVCRAMGHEMAGKPEFTVFHDGVRYQFPNAKMRDMFAAAPKKYAADSAGTLPASGSSTKRAGSGSGSR